MSTPDGELVIEASRAWIDGSWRAAQVRVRGGRVAALHPLGTPVSLDATVHRVPDHLVLLPGFVDSHVHVNEPGRTEWEGFATATRAALAAGVTTIVDMPLNSAPVTTTPGALRQKRAAAAAGLAVDVAFWGGAVPENLDSLGALHGAGVRGVKAFLAPSGIDEFGHLDSDELVYALSVVAELDSVLLVHAEVEEQSEAGAPCVSARLGPHYRDFLASRPASGERRAIESVVAAVRRTGGRAHIVHLSDAGSLDLLRGAKAEGLPITVETCAHYLVLHAEAIPDGATQFKCCPPIREARNADALWQGVLDGTIDAVVSDHSPAPAELKLRADGDFGLAWGGIAGLEVAVAATWGEARRRGLGLEAVLPLVTTGPAAIASLAAGRIAVGAAANLIAFDPEVSWWVDAARLQHRHPISAFDRIEVAGRAETVWLHGAVAVADASFVDTAAGQDLTD